MTPRLPLTRMSTAGMLLVAFLLLAGAWLSAQAQERAPSADVSITQRVESAFAKDRLLGAMEIYVETQDGVVNLKGFVRSLEDISRAGELARTVRGVSAVRNGLRVANRPSQA